MPVFRVEKNKDFTVMSNHHLRNQNISLKAKGLLSQMLSLPPDWDYTLAGLAAINLEGVDAIREAVRELEKAGYITREQKRASGGHFSTNVYVIREVPLLENPITVNPATGKPMAVTPITGPPMTDNPTEISKEGANTERQNTDCINNQSNQIRAGPLEKADRMRLDRDLYRAIVKENIEYDIISQNYRDREEIDELVEIMLDAICSTRPMITVRGQDMPTVFDDPEVEQEVDEILHPEKYENTEITVLVVQPEMEPEVRQISTGLDSLQHEVGGMIEVVYPFDDNVGLIMNEESKLEGLPLNRGLFDDEGRLYDVIAGTFIVAGLTEDNFGSLTPEQLQKYSELYKQPQMFMKLGRDIVLLRLYE